MLTKKQTDCCIIGNQTRVIINLLFVLFLGEIIMKNIYTIGIVGYRISIINRYNGNMKAFSIGKTSIPITLLITLTLQSKQQ